MKKRLLVAIATLLISTVILLVLMGLLSEASSGVTGVVAATPPDAHSSRGDDNQAFTANSSISYYLDDFDYPHDSLNNFIAQRGVFCCEAGGNCSDSACTGDNLLSVNCDEVIRYGDSGASLKLNYNVEQANSLASYYEYLHHGDTSYDLSSFDEFYVWVKGEGNTIGSSTKFFIRFADKGWNIAYVEIVGVGGEWEKKTVDLEPLNSLDWKQMNEMTIIFEHNRDNSGRYTYPLSGTLYFDNMVFVDKDTTTDSDDEFLDLLERRAFQYFWEYADPTTGLVRDRATDPDASSIAAVGFGLTAICVAEERGWITYDEAYTRVLTTLNSFYDDPSSPDDLVISGTRGLFYHFVNIHDGTPMPWGGNEVSTIDSALLMAGVLYCRQHFSGTEIMTLATKIYEAAEWNWFFNDSNGLLYMKWTPGGGLEGSWEGYNEAMILYLLAIGSPTHPILTTSWTSWADSYEWGAYYGYPVLTCPALFTHQYSHCWVDFRGKKDSHANYFRNSRYATLANRAYSKDIWYSDPALDLWGITACDGPEPGTCDGKTYRVFFGYPPDTGNNDGTIAPTAAGGSIVFTPEYSISALRYMYEHYHQRLWGLYGLKDSLNAACAPDWFANDYIGIDVGAMLVMIENYRSNLVWDTFMRNQEIVEAMEAVGFTPDQTKEPSWFYYREAEQYDAISGTGIQIEDHDKAWSRKTLQIDEGEEPNPGNLAVYTFNMDRADNSSVLFEIRYSETVTTPTDTIGVYLDGVEKGSFSTEYTGEAWNSFSWDEERINLGIVSLGSHTITLQLTESATGSHGVNLDVFRLYTAFDVTKQANPNLVRPGAPLTYTLSVTNTSGMTLTATITDILPNHVIPTGVLTWAPPSMAPDGVWTETVVVNAEMDYVGPLTNVVQVMTEEGVTCIYTETSMCDYYYIYLPLVLKNHS